MLKIRKKENVLLLSWIEASPGNIFYGLYEDNNYVIYLDGVAGAKLYIDDVEIESAVSGEFHWRPCFYAGCVKVEVEFSDVLRQNYLFDVSPDPIKSGESQFNEMVAAIRAFDIRYLAGRSAASMYFGREGAAGFFFEEILLSRVRTYGKSFLDAVNVISFSPHRLLSADSQVLPLSSIRKLHQNTLRDRRLAVLAYGNPEHIDALQTIQLRSITSNPTFDTPANQTLLALLKRFRATVLMLKDKVESKTFGIQNEEQDMRAERRHRLLDEFELNVSKLMKGRFFSEISNAQITSSGLMQIAAQPIYSKAYRSGSRALMMGIEGSDLSDAIHVAHSWGIYETWCYLAVLDCVEGLVESKVVETIPKAVSAKKAFSTQIGTLGLLEIIFQGNFPSLNIAKGRVGYSISKTRIPDIVLILYGQNSTKMMVLDAKWRSGRVNVLDAMESAHIYHDALRVSRVPPSLSLLLFPGDNTVPELETDEFILVNGVGAISGFGIGMKGLNRLRDLLHSWLAS